ncbi:hypothetical protein KIL84_022895 [Mauremys mutica]|uniref:Uncharacterized protein n=1 Tax=Mauremys mutica TaxID=74926 RepID=A0A9D3WP95_9SAUR|nr:hypothetical protein KIL84_022895 [Mauremys mutica]
MSLTLSPAARLSHHKNQHSYWLLLSKRSRFGSSMESELPSFIDNLPRQRLQYIARGVWGSLYRFCVGYNVLCLKGTVSKTSFWSPSVRPQEKCLKSIFLK